jgi:hypothetical protein
VAPAGLQCGSGASSGDKLTDDRLRRRPTFASGCRNQLKRQLRWSEKNSPMPRPQFSLKTLLWLLLVVAMGCTIGPTAYDWAWERFWPGSYYLEMDRRIVRHLIDQAKREGR